MYLCREMTSLSYSQIGRAFGNRDHTTVQHACRKIEGMLEDDPHLAADVARLAAEIRAAEDRRRP